MTIDEEKEKIRTAMRARLQQQSFGERRRKSETISEKLQEDPKFRQAERIMFYLSTKEEVDTMVLVRAAIKSGRTVIAPFVDRGEREIKPYAIRDITQDTAEGSYRILEPRPDRAKYFDARQIDLVLVPALAFDHARQRLGRGGGYYDRFLEKLPDEIPVYGMAFQFQIVSSLPVALHDKPVWRVFHESM